MTAFMRSTMRPRPGIQQGLSEQGAATATDRVRDTLAVRCAGMEATAPEALDLAAEVLSELHTRLAGRASALAGNRASKYFREQLRGEHAITLEDLARLALEAPTALGPALDVLARPTGYRLIAREVTAVPDSVFEATAKMQETAGAFFAALTRALREGRASEDVKREAERCERGWAALREIILKVTG